METVSSSVRDIGAGFWAGFLWFFTGLWLLLCLANQAEAFGGGGAGGRLQNRQVGQHTMSWLLMGVSGVRSMANITEIGRCGFHQKSPCLCLGSFFDPEP